MAQRFYLITYRLPGKKPLFFRGDDRYSIYLPRLNNPGWVHSVEEARLFVRYPDFGEKSINNSLNASRIVIFPYEGEVGHRHIIRPTRRPSRVRNRSGKV